MREVPRYRGALSAAFALVVAGTLLVEPWVVALAGVPVLFAAYSAVSGVPSPDLAVERTVDPERPVPGDRVSVALTVRNEGESPLPDVRVADGVPEGVAVVDGSPRGAVAVAPDDVATIEYAVEPTRGEHAFEPPRIRVRGVAGGSYRDVDPSVTGTSRIAARLFLDEPLARRETATLVGAVPTDEGGSGVEFHTTREYRPGDPINRIDWRRLARGGDLSTVNFREHRGVAVAVVADCRASGDLAPAPGAPPSTDLCRYAADRLLRAFVDDGQTVGLAVVGPEEPPWVEPGATDVVARGRAALRSVDGEQWDGPRLRLDAFAAEPATVADRLDARLPTGGQVLFVSPLADDRPVPVARQLAVRDHPVTVVTPSLGAPDGPGARLAAVARRNRIDRLRAAGARVVDWNRTEPLALAVEAAREGVDRW